METQVQEGKEGRKKLALVLPKGMTVSEMIFRHSTLHETCVSGQVLAA